MTAVNAQRNPDKQTNETLKRSKDSPTKTNKPRTGVCHVFRKNKNGLEFINEHISV
jgi:hypothetical protein